MRWTPLILMLGLLLGCATPKYNYAPQVIEISEPPIGSVNVAYVGDNLLRQGTYREHDAIRLNEEVEIGLFSSYTFTPGHYLKEGEDGNAEYYRPSSVEGSGEVITSALADPFQAIMVYVDRPRICGVSVLDGKSCKDDVLVERFKKPILTSDSFQQTLIYSGRVGQKINVGYREFSGSSARPAFNNDVEYDLSESDVIGYKGAQIEVLEATNQLIRYKVIRNFNRAAY